MSRERRRRRTNGLVPASPTSIRRAGRPSKLTPEVADSFFNCIKAGGHRVTCARYVGLSPRTVADWILVGSGGRPDRPPSPEMRAFYERLVQAEAVPEVMAAGNWLAHTAKDHNAAARFLKTRYPERWNPEVERDPDIGETHVVPAAPESGPTVVVDQRQQVIMLAPEQLNAILDGQLDAMRAARRARPVPAVTDEASAVNGIRIARLDGLRSDEGEPIDDE